MATDITHGTWHPEYLFDALTIDIDDKYDNKYDDKYDNKYDDVEKNGDADDDEYDENDDKNRKSVDTNLHF